MPAPVPLKSPWAKLVKKEAALPTATPTAVAAAAAPQAALASADAAPSSSRSTEASSSAPIAKPSSAEEGASDINRASSAGAGTDASDKAAEGTQGEVSVQYVKIRSLGGAFGRGRAPLTVCPSCRLTRHQPSQRGEGCAPIASSVVYLLSHACCARSDPPNPIPGPAEGACRGDAEGCYARCGCAGVADTQRFED